MTAGRKANLAGSRAARFVALVCLFVSAVTFARAAGLEQNEEGEAARESTTLQFLAALSLQRLEKPPPLCQRLYASLDASLDRLVDTTAWHQYLSLVARSALPQLLSNLRQRGCNDDLATEEPGQSESCFQLVESGRRQLLELEHSRPGRMILADEEMQNWLLYNRVGRQYACFAHAEAFVVERDEK